MSQSPDKPPVAPDAAAPERLPYEPPAIEEIDLVPGEALLGFCKSAPGGGVMQACGSCGAVGS